MMCRQVEQARSENQILLEETGVLDASLTRLQQQTKMLSEHLRICEEARSEVSEHMERYRGNVEGLEDTVKRHQEEKHQLSVQLRTLHDETNVAHDDVKNGFEHLLSQYIYCRMGMGIHARPVNTLPSTGQPSTALSARPLWDPLRVAKALSQLDTERVDQNLRLALDLIKTQPDSRNVFIPLLGLFHHLENLRSPSVISNNVAASQLTLAYVRGLTADYIATTISIKEGGKERADKRMGFFHGCRKICVKSGIDSKALGLESAVIHILASRTSLPP